jgi:hypothetical protein
MPVTFKGGTSGDKYDYAPETSRPFDNQVPQKTESNNCTSNVQWTQNSGNREGDASPSVPCNGTPDDSAQ